MAPIERLLIANRGEIAIRIHRACADLGIRSIAIHSHEDRYSLHRFKADEAYPLGDAGEPVRAYLDVGRILGVAREARADAVHPGYGFLSENATFAAAVRRAGLRFVGPTPELLEQLGDKVRAREAAERAGLPLIPGSPPVATLEEARAQAEAIGYPLMVKAAGGGGGRGLRIARTPRDLEVAFGSARSEAGSAFGNDAVFLERLLERPKHIEVQILADEHGDVVHLWERDCSIQRRHQKVLELAPAPHLDPDVRRALCESAVAFARSVGYRNAGTVEFLLEGDEFFFIEMNPRIQVEHTVTEEVTGIDLVASQIRIAEGATLEELGIRQDEIATRGVAIQCRITTENPQNRFTPDFGRISGYRSPGGPGVRLDAGSAFTGALITPYYDSLLVKLTTRGRNLEDVARRARRALSEFRVRGVETNVQFLENLLRHPSFLAGECTTHFIDETPELLATRERGDGGDELVRYLADVTVNGRPGVDRRARPSRSHEPFVPGWDASVPPPPGTRQILEERGAEGFVAWMAAERRLLVTDTTFRDAHQSLLATRMRTHDMLAVAPALARSASGLFSLEMWGGATFDVAMRFLDEDPWERLDRLREAIPNILFQMLLRGANAVGYTTYPDAVVRRFVREAAARGIDLFRIFDSLNWTEQMQVAIDAVRESGKIAEAAICYTGDILDPSRERYALDYYVKLAKDLVDRGAHVIAIKDMAGLLKPYAAGRLVRALKDEVGVPIHLHSHDTAGVQAAAYLQAAEAGVDAVDCAFGPLSGSTSQPNLQSVVAMMEANDERRTGLPLHDLLAFDAYWEATRELYAAFDRAPRTGSAEVYEHEIPGGQYTNLRAQAVALGLGDRWREVTRMYARVNDMFGDIVKVTPSSKVVGDLALYMLSNDLEPEAVLERGSDISFPESVIGFFEGRIGQPAYGFPERLQQLVLKGRAPITGRPGADLPDIDWDVAAREAGELLGRDPSASDVLSYVLYPRVFRDFAKARSNEGDVSALPTRAFFFGLEAGEEVHVQLEPGKVSVIRLIGIGEPNEEGRIPLFFELDGQPQRVSVRSASLASTVQEHRKADPDDPRHVAAPLTGLVASYSHEVGDRVAAGERLCVIEAMKMETNVFGTIDAKLAEIVVPAGERVEAGDLLALLEPAGDATEAGAAKS
ncbi:MAG: pyruvate carboxylase [Myxococcota bacterium]